MENNPFQTREPDIINNARIRAPQKETYTELREFAQEASQDREVGIVLPVGCGKSGCVTLAPFAYQARRVLVVAPGIRIAEQLHNDFDPTRSDMFYVKCHVLDGPPFPEPVEIRGTTTNLADLEEADIVVTNIQQLQGDENRWLQNLPDDFFDLIQFDEGHHSVAATWETLKNKFPSARIVNYSATPLRADGQQMAGRIIYSYPVFRAIREGYVKRLKAVVLNPTTLRYVRRQDGREVEVSLDEVRRLGEEEADVSGLQISAILVMLAGVVDRTSMAAQPGQLRFAYAHRRYRPLPYPERVGDPGTFPFFVSIPAADAPTFTWRESHLQPRTVRVVRAVEGMTCFRKGP